MALRSIERPLVCLLAMAALVPGAFAQSTAKAGAEFRVSQYATGDQRLPSAVAGPDGTYLVVWESQFQDGDSFGIFGRFLSQVGVPVGPEFQVNQATGSDQKQPSVTVDSAGRYTVVWTGQDVSGGGVFARQYTVAGPIGPEFLVNAYTTGDQFLPKVAAGPGGFGVVWQSAGQGTGAVGRLFTATGAPATDEFALTGAVVKPVVAALDNGRYAVAGLSAPTLAPFVYSQLFDGAGQPVAAPQVLTLDDPLVNRRDHPNIAARPLGTYVVGWWEADSIGGKFGLLANDRGVVLRDHDAGGLPTEFGSAGGAGRGTVARWEGVQAATFAGSGLVAYTSTPGVLLCIPAPPHNGCIAVGPEDGSASGVFAKALGPDGPRVQVNTFTTGDQRRPTVALDPYGNGLIAWQSAGQDGEGFGVYAQRVGGLFAASLQVDPSGNGVLDVGPAETLRPAWTNLSGASRTFGGATFGISGPAGGTYAIVDGAASYGTVPSGATQTCTECYAVRVSLPGPRPAAHMDAYLGETLTPAELSIQKPWALHVGGSFADVSTASPFYRHIETLLHNGITSGCGGGSYCPAAATSRDQMSVFVLLAKQGASYVPPACTTPMFADVPAASPFCRWIEELARRGVVAGCGGGNFCPTAAVTREQMAVFVLRTLDPALDPPACVIPIFGDVPPSSPFCKWIEELARRGVVSGCGGGNYCPQAVVTREQMAVFLSATFALRLY